MALVVVAVKLAHLLYHTSAVHLGHLEIEQHQADWLVFGFVVAQLIYHGLNCLNGFKAICAKSALFGQLQLLHLVFDDFQINELVFSHNDSSVQLTLLLLLNLIFFRVTFRFEVNVLDLVSVNV